MEEIKQKVQDIELALNHVCYDAALIPKLSKLREKLEILQEAVNKKCNIPHVSNPLSCVGCKYHNTTNDELCGTCGDTYKNKAT